MARRCLSEGTFRFGILLGIIETQNNFFPSWIKKTFNTFKRHFFQLMDYLSITLTDWIQDMRSRIALNQYFQSELLMNWFGHEWISWSPWHSDTPSLKNYSTSRRFQVESKTLKTRIIECWTRKLKCGDERKIWSLNKI